MILENVKTFFLIQYDVRKNEDDGTKDERYP